MYENLLDVDLGQTLAEGAGDLVVDGAGGMGDIVGGDAVDAVGTHDDDLVTHLDVGTLVTSIMHWSMQMLPAMGQTTPLTMTLA